MTPWFAATERFDPRAGEAWAKYIAWSGLTQLEELVSLDCMLNPPVFKEMKDEYWAHAVNEDFMFGYFLDLDFLRAQLAGAENYNLLCVYRNPESEPTMPKFEGLGFALLGYDLVDVEGGVSALTNCGGFPDVFGNAEISPKGLLNSHARAVEVQAKLRQLHPEEHHADCHVWAIGRAIEL